MGHVTHMNGSCHIYECVKRYSIYICEMATKRDPVLKCMHRNHAPCVGVGVGVGVGVWVWVCVDNLDLRCITALGVFV